MTEFFKAIDENLNVNDYLKQSLKNATQKIVDIIPQECQGALLEALQDISINFSNPMEGVVYDYENRSINLVKNTSDKELERNLAWALLHCASDFYRNNASAKKAK